MRSGLTTSYPDYADIPVNKDGDYQQLNDAILQIENEFYGTIRPKRSAASGERPLAALGKTGVEYVEVRCVDLDPFEPIGINSKEIRFRYVLLLCLLTESPTDSREESAHGAQPNRSGRTRAPARLGLERDTGPSTYVSGQRVIGQCTYIASIGSARRQQLIPKHWRKK